MLGAFFILAALAAAAGQTPPRPKIPEEFVATITFQSHVGDATFDGEGHWANDLAGGKKLQHFQVTNTAHKDQPMDEFSLQRYDLNMTYQFVAPPQSTHHNCSRKATNGTMESAFGWLAEAAYKGKREIRHHQYDVWAISIPALDVELAVEDNKPAFLMTNSTTSGEFFYDFHEFRAGVPEASMFAIPKECQ